jgi:hypothetical protein
MLLQESDMFMDALTASTKSKEPRKRKRRTSITKDGLSDSKKIELGNNEHNRDASSPPSSPTSPPSHSGSNKDDKSLLSLKPAFKVACECFIIKSMTLKRAYIVIIYECNFLIVLSGYIGNGRGKRR